jgi:hypothetical protein
MPDGLNTLTFNQWVELVFDRPVNQSIWDDRRLDDFTAAPSILVDYIARLFRGAYQLPERFSLEQISQGLDWVKSSGHSDWILALAESSVDWTIRRECLMSIFDVFDGLFVKHCVNQLGHLQRSGDPYPLNSTCYMWWDTFPMVMGVGASEANAFIEAELHVLERTLYLNSEPCVESALHGLAHLLPNTAGAAATVDQFLATSPQLSPALHEYALRAREGAVQ